MRSLITYLGIAFYMSSCSTGESKSESSINNGKASSKGEDVVQNEVASGGRQNDNSGFWQKLVMNELRDNNGSIAAVVPYPASWKIMPPGNGGVTVTGPNGIRVSDLGMRSFMFNYNPSLQGAYAASGQQMREMPGVDQLMQQDFVPWGASKGLQMEKYYEIPEVSKMDKWYSDQLYKAMPSRSDVVAIGIDWKTQEGNPYFQIVHLNVSTSQTLQTWYYMVTALEADAAHFEVAKKQYIFGLANMRYNLQPIMVYNQQEAQRVGQSWAAHNQRMMQNQANFEASQRAHVNKSNAINDMIMNGWRERNASSDKNQEQFMDNIYERTNVVDPTTGAGYKVSAGSNNYWMNSKGEYIGTQLQDYDPNLDKNMNEQKWQELKLRDQ